MLSWERSAFGFLVGGALVMLRQHGPLGPGRTALALTAMVLALLVLALGYRRARQIRAGAVGGGRVVVPAPRTEILLIGGATIAFAATVVVALLISVAFG